MRAVMVLLLSVFFLVSPASASEVPRSLHQEASPALVGAIQATLALSALPEEAPTLARGLGLLQASGDDSADTPSEEVEPRSHWLLRHAAGGTLIGVGALGLIISVPLAIFSAVAMVASFWEAEGYALMAFVLGLGGVLLFGAIAAISVGMIYAGVRIARAKKREAREVALVPTGRGLALVGHF